MIRENMLFISAFFPNPSGPNIATYNRQLLLELTRYYDIDAVVPIPWPLRVSGKIPRSGTLGEIRIKYPTYYYTPTVLRRFYGQFYHQSIKGAVAELVSQKKYHMVYSSWLYPDAWVAAQIARELGLPLFVSVLGTDVNRLGADSFLAERAREVVEQASRVKCVSRALMDKLTSLGCRREKLFCLQNGIDSNIFRPLDRALARKETGLSRDEEVILYVGNLKREKGLAELAHAFAALVREHSRQKCRLVVIGSGAFRNTFEKLLMQLGVRERCELLGERSLAQIATCLNASDLLCLPSYSEGQPNVVMEALSCHTRVVATNVGGTPDLDDGYGNIRLVEPRNVPQLIDALLETLEDQTDHRMWRSFNTWSGNAAAMHEIFNSGSAD